MSGHKDNYYYDRNDGYVVSWIGYIFEFARGLWLLLPMLFFPIFAPVLIPLFIIRFIYRALYLRTIRLYANNKGVWVSSGLFPWQRASSGVRWHNVDEATTGTSLTSWAIKSYPVHVSNRYTKSLEIAVGHIAHGDEFVHRVNAVIGRLYQSDLIIEPITRKTGYKLSKKDMPAVE